MRHVLLAMRSFLHYDPVIQGGNSGPPGVGSGVNAMSVSYDAYRMFYYVGRYQNITRAAAELFLSQSTVTRGIQSLELSFGCRLFDRSQHGVSFTQEGQALYEYVSKACDLISRGEELVQQMAGSALRVGVSDFAYSLFVIPVIEAFHRSFPNVKLEIVSRGFSSYDAVFASLLAGKTDVACVAAATPEGLANDAVDILPVASYRDVVVAGDRFHELKNGSYSLAELSSYPFASLVTGSTPNSYLDKVFRDNGIHIAPEFKTDSTEMFFSIIRQGQCLVLIPALFNLTKDRRLFEVRLSDPLPVHKINILTVKGAPRSDMKAAFIHHLKMYIQNHPDAVPISEET